MNTNETRTLRDDFAIAALQGMAVAAGFQGAPWEKLARDAYEAADAMLAARKMGADAPVSAKPEVEKPLYPDDRRGWTEHDGSDVNPAPGKRVERLFKYERDAKSYCRDPVDSDSVSWGDDIAAFIVLELR